MQIKIAAITRKERVSSKTGKPFTSLGIKVAEGDYKDRWISGFDGLQTKEWKDGDTVEVEVEKKGDFLNFSLPKKDSGPAANSAGLSEIKNLINFGVIEPQKNLAAAVEELKFLIQALGTRLDHFIKSDEPEEDAPPF